MKRVRIIPLLLVSLLFNALAVNADVLKIRQGAPERYIVKKGDTLWDISAIYLDQPWLWPKLWRLNPQIKNPHLIYPGDALSLSYDAQGNPVLAINQKFVKLSPTVHKTDKKTQPIPTLPLKLISPFLSYEQSFEDSTLAELPYVLGSAEHSKNWLTEQILYVNQPLTLNKTYAIYRKGQAYRNIDEDQVLGYQTNLVATAKVIRAGDAHNPATIKVISAYAEIKSGDKVLPVRTGQSLPVYFKISEPDPAIKTTIIASPGNYQFFSKYDVVVLNSGSVDNVKVGNLLNIYHQSPTVLNMNEQPKYFEDASRFEKLAGAVQNTLAEDDLASKIILTMPSEKIAEMVVFRVYEKISYALITVARQPARVGDTAFAPSLTPELTSAQDGGSSNDNTAPDSWFYATKPTSVDH